MAFRGFLSGLASFINTYATPVALSNTGWKTYTIFLIFHAVQWLAMWAMVVETKGCSLEELEEIFRDLHPVRKSSRRHEVVVKQGEDVKMKMS